MADNSGGGAGLGVIVGGLLVAVLVIGFLVLNGGGIGGSKHVDINVRAPDISAPAAPAAPSSG
ncbi:MAG: hypothetical protein JO127_02475 [Caulobacteraceae bacterium]|nr:hypothetical protein [Caulobacteraceae bacterium]